MTDLYVSAEIIKHLEPEHLFLVPFTLTQHIFKWSSYFSFSFEIEPWLPSQDRASGTHHQLSTARKAVWSCWSSTLVRRLFSDSLGHQLHHSLLEDDTSEGGGQGKYLDLLRVRGRARRKRTHGFWLGHHTVATSLRLSQSYIQRPAVSLLSSILRCLIKVQGTKWYGMECLGSGSYNSFCNKFYEQLKLCKEHC